MKVSRRQLRKIISEAVSTMTRPEEMIGVSPDIEMSMSGTRDKYLAARDSEEGEIDPGYGFTYDYDADTDVFIVRTAPEKFFTSVGAKLKRGSKAYIKLSPYKPAVDPERGVEPEKESRDSAQTNEPYRERKYAATKQDVIDLAEKMSKNTKFNYINRSQFNSIAMQVRNGELDKDRAIDTLNKYASTRLQERRRPKINNF